jgi:hypothetical protein
MLVKLKNYWKSQSNAKIIIVFSKRTFFMTAKATLLQSLANGIIRVTA